MELEQLILIHNEMLEKEAANNPFREHKILNLIEDKSKGQIVRSRIKIWSPSFAFGFIVLVFTLLSFTIVGELEKVNIPSTDSVSNIIDTFQTNTSGSLDEYLKEIIK